MIHITSKYKTGLGIAMMLLGLVSCSNEDYLAGHAVADGAGTMLSIKTTIASALFQGTSLTENDCYGLSVGYDDNKALNKKYVVKSSGDYAFSGIPIYIKTSTTLTAYYPYCGSESSDPFDSVSTLHQDKIDPFFIGSSQQVSPATTETVQLQMHDLYGRLALVVKVPDDDTVNSFLFLNVNQSASVNFRDGTMNYATNIENLRGAISSNDSIRLVLLPQDLTEENKVRMIINGVKRSYVVIFDSLRIESGLLTSGTVTLSKQASGIYTPDDFSQWQDSQTGAEGFSGSGVVTFDRVAGQWLDSGTGGSGEGSNGAVVYETTNVWGDSGTGGSGDSGTGTVGTGGTGGQWGNSGTGGDSNTGTGGVTTGGGNNSQWGNSGTGDDSNTGTGGVTTGGGNNSQWGNSGTGVNVNSDPK